jgi:hypothetical protein
VLRGAAFEALVRKLAAEAAAEVAAHGVKQVLLQGSGGSATAPAAGAGTGAAGAGAGPSQQQQQQQQQGPPRVRYVGVTQSSNVAGVQRYRAWLDVRDAEQRQALGWKQIKVGGAGARLGPLGCCHSAVHLAKGRLTGKRGCSA